MRLAIAALAVMCGCGGQEAVEGPDAGAPALSPAKIGSMCSTQEACKGGLDLYCTQDHTCTRECNTHSDCGCAAGTSNGDITNGACGYACILYSTKSFCLKTCKATSECAPTNTCDSVTGFKVCN